MRELRAKEIKIVADESLLSVPAAGSLMNVLGHLEEVVRLNEPVVQKITDYRSAQDTQFVLYQQELEGLPGIILDWLDDNGPVWLRVESLKKSEPPPIDADLGVWIEVFAEPDRTPSIRDSVTVTVDAAEKDRLVADQQVRASDLEPAIHPDRRHYNIFNARLRLVDYPGLAARLNAYVAGPWSWWARAEKLRRKTMAIHARLSNIMAVGDPIDRSHEIVWGIGVSRWQRDGSEIVLPIIERLVSIEVGENNEIRIRPRLVGAIADLRGFQTGRAAGATSAVESARRIIEAIEHDSEVSPFVHDSFEAILRIVTSQLDPEGVYHDSGRDRLEPGATSPNAPEHLDVSDRWAIFARPRTNSFVLRDIERFRDAIDRLPMGDGDLPMLARALSFGASDDARTGARQALPGIIGRPIDIEPVAEHANAEFGDLFFPLPSNADQIDLVRRLQGCEALVVRAAPGSAKVDAIVNVVCHHLALGLRVLVVCRGKAAVQELRDKFPAVIRDLTIGLTGGDREELMLVEAAVRRLQLIVETLKPHDHVDLINRSEQDVIATRQAIKGITEEAARIARSTPGLTELPLDLVRKLVVESRAHAWFEDRPSMLLTETGISLAAVDAARDARVRLGADLRHIDDDLPAVAQLPEPATVARMHRDLAQAVEPERSLTEPSERSRARRTVSAVDVAGATQFAEDLEALAAAHLAVVDEPWLGPPCPLRKRDGAPRADSAALVDFARDVTSHLFRRGVFLSRAVDTPAEAFADRAVFDVVARLSAGEKVSTTFASRERRRVPALDAITVAGLAPAGPDDWQHVRDYLTWRRDLHALSARWKLLAVEFGAPSLTAEYPQVIHGFARVVNSINVAIVRATIAERNVTSIAGSKLMMSRSDILLLLTDARELQQLGAAVRTAVTEREVSRLEFTRLQKLFAGEGELPAAVRNRILARIGHDGTDADEVSAIWTRLREQIVLLHDRREDFNRVDAIGKAFAEAGAPILAHRVKTEAAKSATDDHLLAADWAGAWNWAALTRQMKEVGQDQQLLQLAGRREQLETTMRDQFEAVVAARTDFAAAQNLSGTVRRALTVSMIALQKMASAVDGQAANQHRRMAREALDGCSEGIPCWIMPNWRVAERLPARLGGFDLVIIDDASGSYVRELTTLLRGRKILVIGDDKQAGPSPLESGNVQTEGLGGVFLRALPRTIRPFVQQGSSLYDFAKVIFPGNQVHLREGVHGAREPPDKTSGSGDLPPIASTASAEDAQPDQTTDLFPAPDQPWAPRPTSVPSAANLANEISRVIAHLPRASRLRAQSMASTTATWKPTSLDETLVESPPIASDATSFHQIVSDDQAPSEHSREAVVALPSLRGDDNQTRRFAAEGHLLEPRSVELPSPRWLVRAESVDDDAPRASRTPMDEALPDATMPAAGAAHDVVVQPRGADARWSVNGLGVAIAAVLVVVMVSAAAYWLSGLGMNSGLAASILSSVSRDFTLPPFAKSADRVTQGSRQSVVARLPQDVPGRQSGNVATARIDPLSAGNGPSTAPIEQRAILYEEDPADPKGKRYAGGVTWRTESISPASGAPAEVVVKADLNVLDAKTAVSMTFRRNTDRTLPASHVVEIKFDRPPDAANGEISKLHGLLVKQEGKTHGIPLEGEAVKVTSGYFMVALSSDAPQEQRNLKLLKENSLFEVVFVYGNGSKAILVIDKGASGEQAFKEAFAAWSQ